MPLTTGPIHGRATRVLFQGRDMSLSLRESSLQLNGDTVETTAFANGVKQYLSGLAEGRVTVNGFYDAGTDGAFHVFMQKFSRGQLGTLVVENQGHAVMGQSTVITGLITSLQLTNQVADVVALNMELMVTGEVYVCRNLFNAGSQFMSSAGKVFEVNRATAMESPYAAAYSGMLYWQFYNPHTATRDFAVNHGASTNPSTALVAATNATAGSFINGVVGTGLVPVTVNQFVEAESTTVYGAGEVASPFYVGLVDVSESLLNL